MAVSHLECKECKARVPAGGAVRLRALLRAARGRLRPQPPRAATSASCAARIQGGPQNIWRYADFLPLAGGPPGPSGRLASRVGPAGRLHAADPRRPARRAARAARGVGQERRRQPDPLVQGPRRLGRRRRARASSASRRSRAPRPATSPTRWRPTARRWGWTPTCSSRPTWRSRRCSRRASTGRNWSRVKGNYDDVNRLCTELCAERDWAFVNINLRPYYAEGSKTLAFEIAEQLGWELPDRCVVPVASGSLFTKIAKGFAEWRELGLLERRAAADERRPGRGLLAGRERVRRRPRRVPAGQARHDRQVAGDRQPRRRSLRARARAPQRRLGRRGQRRGDPRGDRAARRRRRASSPRPPAASRPPCSPSSPRAATSTPTSASCW